MTPTSRNIASMSRSLGLREQSRRRWEDVGMPIIRDPSPGMAARVAAREAERWMGRALDEARLALTTGDVPVGAIVVDPRGQVVGAGRNRREADGDPTAHAEMLALRAAASALGAWRLEGCSLIVTMEPCPMCAGALVAARVSRLWFGAWDPKAGACGSMWDLVRDSRSTHRVEVVGGVRDAECSSLLTEFFDARR